MIQYIKFCLNTLFGTRDRVQTRCFVQNLTFKVMLWPWKWGKGNQKLFLSHVSVVFLCKFGQNPPIGSGDRVLTRLIFTVFIVWWPWKLGQGCKNLINYCKYPNDTMRKVGQNPLLGSRVRVQTIFFGQNLTFNVVVWPWKWGQGQQNLIISSLCSIDVSLLFGQNPPIGSGDRV